jgi:hypothetical protein
MESEDLGQPQLLIFVRCALSVAQYDCTNRIFACLERNNQKVLHLQILVKDSFNLGVVRGGFGNPFAERDPVINHPTRHSFAQLEFLPVQPCGIGKRRERMEHIAVSRFGKERDVTAFVLGLVKFLPEFGNDLFLVAGGIDFEGDFGKGPYAVGKRLCFLELIPYLPVGKKRFVGGINESGKSFTLVNCPGAGFLPFCWIHGHVIEVSL